MTRIRTILEVEKRREAGKMFISVRQEYPPKTQYPEDSDTKRPYIVWSPAQPFKCINSRCPCKPERVFETSRVCSDLHHNTLLVFQRYCEH